MKKKINLALLVVLLGGLSSCDILDEFGNKKDTSEIEEEFDDFADKELNEAIGLSKDEQKEIKNSIHNIYTMQKMYMSYGEDSALEGVEKEEYVEFMNATDSIDAPIYYDLDNNYVEGEVLGYTLAVKKNGRDYERYGSYWDLVSSIMEEEALNELAKSFFEPMDYSYAWELSDTVTKMFVPSDSSSMGGSTITITVDDEWYEQLYLAEQEKEGTFTIKLDGEIKISETMTTDDYTMTVELIYDYIELKYTDYLLDYCLFSLYENVDYSGYATKIHMITYTEYDYNVSRDVFTPSYL